MHSPGKDDTARSQLIGNAEFVNLPERRFLDRMQPQARQEVKYGLRTSCSGIDLHLTVLASGIMSLEACMWQCQREQTRTATTWRRSSTARAGSESVRQPR